MNTRPILDEILLPWQRRWVEDGSRFKIGMWSRQTGKSFSTAAEAVSDCAAQPKGSNALWVVLSAGERQALEWMEKAKRWAEAFKQTVDSYEEIRGSAEALMTKAEIRFGNGARILAISANPDTARGYSANLILDEFAIHEKPFEIWSAIYPSITNPLTGEKKLRIVSTPKGRGNKFADLWEHNGQYSKHKVTIEQAVREGLFGEVGEIAESPNYRITELEGGGTRDGGAAPAPPGTAAPNGATIAPLDGGGEPTGKQGPWARLAELKAGVDDPDIWAQEYMCEFIDNSSVLLPYEMIGKCESERIADDGASPLYVGMDVGRSKDLSVIVTAVKLGDVIAVTDVTELRKMAFSEQLEVLVGKCRQSRRLAAVRIDATGIGAMLAEEATKRLGGVCQGVNFNVATKGEMYGLMRRRFEERSVRIPVRRELREDLHAVQRLVSSGGTVTYAAPRNADGHSDRAAALALVCLGAANTGDYIKPFGTRRSHAYDLRRI